MPVPDETPAAPPLHSQISALLLERIAAGELLEGQRLPPERKLAGSLGVSVGTLRKALAELARKGLLDRRQGSGNYIRHARDLGGLYGFFRIELLSGGGWPSAELLDCAMAPAPAGAGPFAGRHSHRIRRLRRLDGQAAVLEEIWLDGARADAMPGSGLDGALYALYREHFGLSIIRAVDRIGLGRVPGWAFGGFAQPPGAACGLVERQAWAADGEITEFSRSWFDQDCCRYVSRQA